MNLLLHLQTKARLEEDDYLKHVKLKQAQRRQHAQGTIWASLLLIDNLKA